ncbi:MAG: hypothetical protein R2747_20425 [Pyrinomonadaceae bacterium]
MAALTKQDVLDTLTDPMLGRFCLYVNGVFITLATFGLVADRIRNGKISVEQGTQTIALYFSKENKIVTQIGSPSAHARALLLHECTHALMDVLQCSFTAVTEEVICYITQHVYLLLRVPGYNPAVNKSLDPVSQDALWQGFYHSIVGYAKRAVNSGGFVIDTAHWEFRSLRNHLRTLNIYQHLTDTQGYTNDGVK